MYNALRINEPTAERERVSESMPKSSMDNNNAMSLCMKQMQATCGGCLTASERSRKHAMTEQTRIESMTQRHKHTGETPAKKRERKYGRQICVCLGHLVEICQELVKTLKWSLLRGSALQEHMDHSWTTREATSCLVEQYCCLFRMEHTELVLQILVEMRPRCWSSWYLLVNCGLWKKRLTEASTPSCTACKSKERHADQHDWHGGASRKARKIVNTNHEVDNRTLCVYSAKLVHEKEKRKNNARKRKETWSQRFTFGVTLLCTKHGGKER